jgi:hypothetical protein
VNVDGEEERELVELKIHSKSIFSFNYINNQNDACFRISKILDYESRSTL